MLVIVVVVTIIAPYQRLSDYSQRLIFELICVHLFVFTNYLARETYLI